MSISAITAVKNSMCAALSAMLIMTRSVHHAVNRLREYYPGSPVFQRMAVAERQHQLPVLVVDVPVARQAVAPVATAKIRIATM